MEFGATVSVAVQDQNGNVITVTNGSFEVQDNKVYIVTVTATSNAGQSKKHVFTISGVKTSENNRTINFEENGGSEVNPIIKPIGDNVTPPANPLRPGYIFDGWFNEASLLNPYVFSVMPELSITLYAKWTPISNTLVFNANYGNGTMEDYSMSTGVKDNLPLNQFTREGYDFEGWATERGGEIEYEDGAEYTMGPETSYTLYAVWQIHNFSITYNLAGGTASDQNPSEYNIFSDTFTILEPVRDGYVFNGWYLDNEFNDEADITVEKGSLGDLVLYAKWSEIQNTLNFYGNGADSGVMNSLTLPTDAVINLEICKYIKAGYTFLGWSYEQDGEVNYQDGGQFVMPATSVITLYAVWEANLNTIRFLGNGAESGSLEDITALTDETLTLPENVFVRSGYTFGGWSLTEQGSAIYEDGDSVIMSPDDLLSLYAVWTPNINTVEYKPNGGTGVMSKVYAPTDTTIELDANSFYSVISSDMKTIPVMTM